MRKLLTLVVALGALLGAASGAQAQQVVGTSYTCDAAYWSFTACARITNNVETFTAPGTLGKVRPLVSVIRNSQACMWLGEAPVWNATSPIVAGATGSSQFNGALCAGGTFVYGMRLQDGPQNYQATVGLRVDNANQYVTCVVTSYLDCTMGPQLETGRDSMRDFKITSRPLEIKIINTLPRAILRTDGPYWSNALSNNAIDGAYEIAAGSTSYTGALRSVVRQTAYAAVYRVRRSSVDPTYNGASLAIDVRIGQDGSKTGMCTPIYAPSRTQLTCTVDFTGSGTGNLIANVRVRP